MIGTLLIVFCYIALWLYALISISRDPPGGVLKNYLDIIDSYVEPWFTKMKEAINKRTTIEQLQFDEEEDADEEEDNVQDAKEEKVEEGWIILE